MSTKATLAYHGSEDGTPSWHLYEEVSEAGVVYLELHGVNLGLSTCEQGGADVVLRLPAATAEQLGLPNVPPELCAEVFEAGVVYLKLHGINVELNTCEQGGADVVLRLPAAIAEQLGLHTNVPPDRWKAACDLHKWSV
ncbi:TPA: hypothetical protein ACK3PA_006122 [Burkholderia cenocepacia]